MTLDLIIIISSKVAKTMVTYTVISLEQESDLLLLSDDEISLQPTQKMK